MAKRKLSDQKAAGILMKEYQCDVDTLCKVNNDESDDVLYNRAVWSQSLGMEKITVDM